MRKLVLAVGLVLLFPLAAPWMASAAAPPAGVPMAGSLSPLAAQAIDLGPAPADLPVRIAVGLDLHDKPVLDDFLARVSDPASPEFQRFLTQDQFNARFGPTPEQEIRVVRWLTEAGFTVTDTFPNHLLVAADGDNAAVQAAFGITLHRVLSRGELGYAAVQAPVFPWDIAKFTTGVVGLDDLARMQPMLREGSAQPLAPGEPGPSRAEAGPSRLPSDGPVAGPRGSVGGNCCAFAPADLATFYDNSRTYTGSGQTIVLAGAYAWKDTDNTAYNNQWGLAQMPAGTAQVCTGPAGSSGCTFNNANSIEIALDVELAHAVAPNAVIKNYMSATTSLTDFQTMYNKVVSDNPGHSVSTSWGSCESNSGSTYQSQNDNIFSNGNAVGQSWFAASGDSGAQDCGTAALVVDHPANAPHMMGVGGTHATCSSGMTNTQPACGGYGSESSWSSGGGGKSNVFTKPSYQTGCSVPADGKRDVPDVSLESDTSPGNYVYYNGAWNVVGGTSDAAPQWGGYFALLNQKIGGSGAGLPGTRIYQLCGGSSYHDITTGNNGGYSAGTGYDLVTGVGTIDANNFLANWAACAGNAPGAPTGLGATGGTGQVALSWTAPGSNGGCAITGYKVYRSTSSGTETFYANTGTGTSYTDTGVTGGTTYYYKVSAVNSIGEGAKSNEASATPAAPACPGPANNCFANAVVINSVPYSATPSTSGATMETGEPAPCGTLGASVWYRVTAGTTGTMTVSTVSGSTNYDTVLASYTGSSLNGLTNVACNDDYSGTQSQISWSCTAGTTYQIQLAGYRAATGTAGFSVTGCGAPTVPGAPTGLTASAGNTQISLSWTAPASNGGSAITGYNLYRSTSSGTETLYKNLGTSTSYTDTGLTNGQAYYYKVTAVNSAGESAKSNEATATPAAAQGPVLNQTFDAGTSIPTGWSASGLWHVASSCLGAKSSPNSLQYNQAASCDYNTGATTTGDATTPTFDINGRTYPKVTFSTKYTVESYAGGSYDKMQVQVKPSGGAWTTIWTRDSTYASQGTWTTVSLNLTTYKSTATQLRFHFDSVDQYSNAYAGWGVDDVVVT